jgi:tetratricopeptide (TPR) repeat protein
MSQQKPIDVARATFFKGDVDGAILQLTGCLNGDFFHDEALFLLTGCMMSKGKHGLAAVLASAAIDSRENKGKHFPEAMAALGGAYKMAGQRETAERIWLDALQFETLPKERSKLLHNISGLYINEGSPAIALRYCAEALKEDPGNIDSWVHRGMASLELGLWRDGWHGLGQSYRSGAATRRTYRDLPEWDGSPGKALIVYGDQGVGDEIFFAECMRDLIRVSRKVTLDCHPRLVSLFARSFPEITVHGTRKNLLGGLEWVDECDAEAVICLAQLPGFFRNYGEWTGGPYLKAGFQGDAEPLGAIVDPRHPRIGLSWTGGTKNTHQAYRSLAIEQLEPIVRARPDAQWFSLQYTPNAAREVCELEERTGIRISHFPGWVECFDYDRTASFVASLDLVITVCTTAHHLAGALGVPVWTLTPSRPNWRYQLSGDRLPWYGSARMFRQEEDGDWSTPIAQIAEAVDSL